MQPRGGPDISYHNESNPATPKSIGKPHATLPTAATYNGAIQALLANGKLAKYQHSRMAVRLFRRAVFFEYRIEHNSHSRLLAALSGRGIPPSTGMQDVFDHYIAAIQSNPPRPRSVLAEMIPRNISWMIYAWTRDQKQNHETTELRERRKIALERIHELQRTFCGESVANQNPTAMLSSAIAKGDIPQAEKIMETIFEKGKENKQNIWCHQVLNPSYLSMLTSVKLVFFVFVFVSGRRTLRLHPLPDDSLLRSFHCR